MDLAKSVIKGGFLLDAAVKVIEVKKEYNPSMKTLLSLKKENKIFKEKIALIALNILSPTFELEPNKWCYTVDELKQKLSEDEVVWLENDKSVMRYYRTAVFYIKSTGRLSPKFQEAIHDSLTRRYEQVILPTLPRSEQQYYYTKKRQEEILRNQEQIKEGQAQIKRDLEDVRSDISYIR